MAASATTTVSVGALHLRPTAQPFALYVRGTRSLAVPEPSFAQHERLLRRGFEEIWDSAPTEQKAYDYAADFYGAFPAGRRACRHCLLEDINPPAEGEHVRGRFWSDAHGRHIIFNGYLCGQHRQQLEPGWSFAPETRSRKRHKTGR
jgi:hypothetical protein